MPFFLSNHIAPEEEKSLEVEEFSSRSTDPDGRQKEEAARNVDERKTVIKRCSSFACSRSVIPRWWNYMYIYTQKINKLYNCPKGGYYAVSPHNITPESNFKVRKIKKMITLQCSSRLSKDFSSSAA